MTADGEWEVLIADVEANTDPLGRVRIAGALGTALTRLSRRDCIFLSASGVRRALPLVGKGTPYARVTWLLVELCEDLCVIDEFPSAPNPANAFNGALWSVPGPWVGTVGLGVLELLRATGARQPDSRARAAADALVRSSMVMAGVAWATERAYPPEKSPVEMSGKDYYDMLFDPAYAAPCSAFWRDICAELRALRPMQEVASAGGTPEGEEPK